ncbi:serine/threonine-protein kinase [Corynebacterium sp.]|uniref:serine/threonine-protein kinase n=1 Tax=Corynebacterium sp. TaxID=1720 RepID=UPI0026DC66E1|nr:serine/threonine-protein kinase [Corynebacterium sp.]MDO5032151.1 protein kinase [Corynebacterium sp.]
MSSADNKDHLQALIGEDYQLQWIIGHGGMSTVWLADDVRNDREVAIKVLRPEFSDNNEFLSRFRNEAESAESIHSENVVATYDYRELEDNGRMFCFMALEYVRGESLADLLARENSLPETLALDVMEQAAHGLSAIHHMGLVHRDIKPGNLMITQNGQVKITDFGIAKAAAAVPLTRTGMVVGTAQYVSPEQAQGMEVTPASDVYSLGVVGYEMLAGRRPFSGDSSVSVALAHISQAPEALSTSISAQTRELIGITLRKDPQTRFADGNELTNAVSAVRAGKRPPQPKSAALAPLAQEPSPSASTEMLANMAQPTTTTPAVAPEEKSRGFGTGLIIAGALAALVVVGLVSYKLFNDGEEKPAQPSEVIVTEYRDPTTTTQAPVTTHTPTQEEEEDTPESPSEVTVTTTRSVHPSPVPSEPVTSDNQAPTQEEQPTQATPEPPAVETPAPETDVDSQPATFDPLDELLNQGGQ